MNTKRDKNGNIRPTNHWSEGGNTRVHHVRLASIGVVSRLAQFNRSVVTPDDKPGKTPSELCNNQERFAFTSAQCKVKGASVPCDAPEQIIGAKAETASFIMGTNFYFRRFPPRSIQTLCCSVQMRYQL